MDYYYTLFWFLSCLYLVSMYSQICFIAKDIRNSNLILDLLYFVVNVNHVDYCCIFFWFFSCLYLGDINLCGGPRTVLQGRELFLNFHGNSWNFWQLRLPNTIFHFGTSVPGPVLLQSLLQPLPTTTTPYSACLPYYTQQLQEQAVTWCGCVLPVMGYYVLRNLLVNLFHLKSISLLRASCRRKGCWLPTKICNSGRLHNHYCPKSRLQLGKEFI